MTKTPPAPPDNRSPKGPGSAPPQVTNDDIKRSAPNDPDQQGRTGNSKQNTTHQGYQQDR
ncbi:MAG TPA: hypothetical protein VNR11_20495 [Xanthobacteraceae bacterium]|nr:hypothetical protein [Xanthobacteraceae bacterium]